MFVDNYGRTRMLKLFKITDIFIKTVTDILVLHYKVWAINESGVYN